MNTRRSVRAHAMIPFFVSMALTTGGIAVLTPMILAARNVSAKENSLNNLRVLAGAVRAYSLDYDGFLPGWVNVNPHGYGKYAHNAWDQQVRPYVNSEGVYWNGGGAARGAVSENRGIRSYSQPRYRDRVLGYGLNGLTITQFPNFNGSALAAFAGVSFPNPPRSRRIAEMAKPDRTILLSELETRAPMPGVLATKPKPAPYTHPADGRWGTLPSAEWQRAYDGWVDVSPRELCEVKGMTSVDSYTAPYVGYNGNGIARDLYDGGGCHAFCDGHVEFLRLADTVGLGKVVNNITITPANCWAPANTWNRWNPEKGPWE